MAIHIAADTAPIALGPPTARRGDDHRAAWETVLVCRTRSHRFALPMRQIVETMRMLPIKSLAGVPPLVLGLCLIRGRPTPVVDAALLFDAEPGRCERLVTVRTGDRTIALAAEAIVGVQAVLAHQQKQLPPLLRNAEAVAAIAALDRGLMFFLDTARLVPDDVLDHDQYGRAQA